MRLLLIAAAVLLSTSAYSADRATVAPKLSRDGKNHVMLICPGGVPPVCTLHEIRDGRGYRSWWECGCYVT